MHSNNSFLYQVENVRWITLIVLTGVLVGCGQKGPLYLEAPKSDEPQAQSQVSSQSEDQNATSQP
jgi:predicted small lipoprotein YifL